MQRRLVLVLVVLAAVVAAPAAGAVVTSPTIRVSILHFFRGCHVWSTSKAPAAKLTVKAGTRVEIRASCPMDFDLVQTAGPKLRLGGTRLYAGRTKTIAFTKRGTYRIRGTNVQSSEQQGLQTLGADNTITLTVVAR